MLQPIKTDAPEAGPCFADYVWQRFDPIAAIETLLKPDESFFAEKQIVYSALATWIVDPTNDDLRRLAISNQIALQLIALEADRDLDYAPALGNVVRHIQQLSEPEVAAFYEKCYFPAGGLKTIVSTRPPARFRDELNISAGGINTAIRILLVYHFHVLYFSDVGSFYPPSLSKAAKLLSKGFDEKPIRGEGGANADNIKKQWHIRRSAISLAYSASSIGVGRKRYTDLLDVMQQGQISWEKHGNFLPKLLNRACFVEDEILSKCYKNDNTPLGLGSLSKVLSQPFKPREISAAEKQKACLEFARRPGVKESP